MVLWRQHLIDAPTLTSLQRSRQSSLAAAETIIWRTKSGTYQAEVWLEPRWNDSDAEEEGDKDIGCDTFTRWFHLKCTGLLSQTYEDVMYLDFHCNLFT